MQLLDLLPAQLFDAALDGPGDLFDDAEDLVAPLATLDDQVLGALLE